jgi:hypothetical protein
MKKAAATLHQSAKALVISAVLGLLLAYWLALRAIDTASLWAYFATLLLVILSINFIVKAVKLYRGSH